MIFRTTSQVLFLFLAVGTSVPMQWALANPSVPTREVKSGDLPEEIIRRIGFFKLEIGGGFYGAKLCTATLIGPSIALTAAHCIDHHYRSRFGNSATLSMPDGSSAKVLDTYVPGEKSFSPKFYSDARELVENQHRDIAILYLDQPLGNRLGWLPVLDDRGDYRTDGSWAYRLLGYQVATLLWALPVGAKWAISKANCPLTFISQFEDAGKTYRMLGDKALISTDCAASHGMSGGPLLAYDRNRKQYWVGGVISGGSEGTYTNVVPTYQFEKLMDLETKEIP